MIEPELEIPPAIEVKLRAEVPGSPVCEWTGRTGRMIANRIYVTYYAGMGSPRWWVFATLEGPVVRADSTPGRSIAHQVYRSEECGENLDQAPEWVRRFVQISEPPAYMRGC